MMRWRENAKKRLKDQKVEQQEQAETKHWHYSQSEWQGEVSRAKCEEDYEDKDLCGAEEERYGNWRAFENVVDVVGADELIGGTRWNTRQPKEDAPEEEEDVEQITQDRIRACGGN
jgi:hypothetical protein